MDLLPTLLLVAAALVVLGIVTLGVVGIIRKAINRPARRFAEVERQAVVLRQQLAQSLISDAECKARMRELVIAGPDGRWWMVGYRTGSWYAHDGTGWTPAAPP